MGSQTNHLAVAMVGYQTLSLDKSMGFTKVWLEGDSNNIVQCLKGLSSPSWTIKNIISQAKEIINSFKLCVVSHNYRETNTVADWAVNMAVRADHTMSWRGELDLPHEVCALLIYDRVYGYEGVISNYDNALINEKGHNELERAALED